MTGHGGSGDLDDFFGRPRAANQVALLAPPEMTPQRGSARRARSSNRAAPPTRRPAPAARRSAPATSRTAPVRPPRAPRPARPAASPSTRRPGSGPRRRPPIDGSGEAALRRTRRRLIILVVGVGLLMLAIVGRLADLQVANPDQYVAYGLGQRDGYRDIPAGRGAIYDRSGRAFALSVARPTIVADPSQIEHPIADSRLLGEALGMDPTEIEAKLRADNRYQILAPTVADGVAAKVRALELPGIDFEDQYVRSNPSGDLARSVVGRVAADGGIGEDGRQGISGLEAADDAALTGRPGKAFFERDPSGRTIAGGRQRLEPSAPGTNLYLTIDQSMQYETEQVLQQQVRATGARNAMAVVTRPSTGEILSMASVGSDADGTIANTSDNKPVTAAFEPGSVNKMITIAGALEEGVVKPDTMVTVPDHLQVADHAFTDHDPHPVQDWSVTDILVTSSNVGTIKVAQQLGATKVDRYLRDFGFGATTGLGFPAEEDGIMAPLDGWSGTSIGSIPIGQGIAVTALQLVAAYNVIANDGVYVAPKLVAATDEGAGRVDAEPSGRRRVVSAETAQAVRLMLRQVVSDGTGKKAAVPGYDAAGKTGTARIPQQGADAEDGYKDANGRYVYQSTFVGFVDGADLSIVVTLDDAKTSIFGGDVGGPVFSKLASLALRRFRIPPPALATSGRVDVPQLSASAREIGGEDPLGGSQPAAG